MPITYEEAQRDFSSRQVFDEDDLWYLKWRIVAPTLRDLMHSGDARERQGCTGEDSSQSLAGENDHTRNRETSGSARQEICSCLASSSPWLVMESFGSAFANADAEAFTRIRDEYMSPGNANVFVIGNSFGFSSIFLALLFTDVGGGGGFVDAIDPGPEGACRRAGAWITRKIAAGVGLDVKVTEGFSPYDIPYAVRPHASYDIGFIDGLHTIEQLSLDLSGIEPFMAKKAILVLHDVLLFELQSVVERASLDWGRHVIKGKAYKNFVGTVLLHRGFPVEWFADL